MNFKRMIWKIYMAALLVGLFTGITPSLAAGLLTPKNSNLPELALKDHKVNVIIEDGYAVTTVEQSFHNPHNMDLEAIYSFPVPEKAAVSELTMWIDGKPVQGEVLENQQARQVYEDQKSQNKSAGLTQKNDHKTFQINVYPVRAGQETKIRLSYYQPTFIDTSVGRYVYPLEEGGVDEQALAFWTTNDKVMGTFSFDAVLRPSYPLDGVRLPNHAHAQIIKKGSEYLIHLDNKGGPKSPTPDPDLTINSQQAETIQAQDQAIGVNGSQSSDASIRLNSDIVVYYRYDQHLPGAVDLVAHKEKGADRGTFMLTVTPGMDLKPITQGRDWVFVLDISGSMSGKYATLAEGVGQALQKMSGQDRFRIILFNINARELTSGLVPATPENVGEYIEKVRLINPDQGTNLYAGLEMGLRGLDADRTTSILLVTDGVANVGVTQQKDFVRMLKNYDVRLFTFIMGNSANEPLLNALTRISCGFAINISNSDDIIGKIMEAQSKVNYQALSGVKLSITGIRADDISPKDIRTLYRGQQLVLLGHYFGAGRAKVSLEGKISGDAKTYVTEFDFPEVAQANPEIERLWAFAKIEQMSQEIADFGESTDLKRGIIDLGVEFGLVTDDTSMVVVEEEVFKALGITQRNKQRLDKEFSARQARMASAIVSRRVDAHQPMFNANRPTYSGGAGAFGPLALAFLAPLAWGLCRRSRKKG